MKTFEEMFNEQMKNQKKLIRNGSYDRFANMISDELPRDDTGLFSYHIQQLMSEIGEVLEADKRWKNFRNARYDKDKKLDELADCMIVLMNIVMFSGFSAEDILKQVEHKLGVFSWRIKNGK